MKKRIVRGFALALVLCLVLSATGFAADEVTAEPDATAEAQSELLDETAAPEETPEESAPEEVPEQAEPIATAPTTSFSDTVGHWASDNIEAAVEAGIVGGYADGTFLPNKAITRAEFVTMLMSIIGDQLPSLEAPAVDAEAPAEDAEVAAVDTEAPDEDAEVADEDAEAADEVEEAAEVEETPAEAPAPAAADNFADCENHWASESIKLAKAYGIITGDENGNFDPNAAISRQDLATILNRALNVVGATLASGESVTFADQADIAAYAADAVNALQKAGIITGTNGNFAPKSNATRAETVTILVRAFNITGNTETTGNVEEAPAENIEAPAEDAGTTAEGEDAAAE